ncbi:hypothetical protein HMPREF9374_0971 [Desmospora sp. 8437]|nr:hypothetical protein HMPREF9374_0971 [Desmospora sp. 8437]
MNGFHYIRSINPHLFNLLIRSRNRGRSAGIIQQKVVDPR